MNALKVFMHAFDGVGREPGSLRGLASQLWRKTVRNNVNDSHGTNEFFDHVLDAHILTCIMKEIQAKPLAELHQWLHHNNQPIGIT